MSSDHEQGSAGFENGQRAGGENAQGKTKQKTVCLDNDNMVSWLTYFVEAQSEATAASVLQRNIRKQQQTSKPTANTRLPSSTRGSGPQHNELSDTDASKTTENGSESEDSDEGSPITRKSVKHIARAVVREELRHCSTGKPKRKTSRLSEESEGVRKEDRLRYCVSKSSRFAIVNRYSHVISHT